MEILIVGFKFIEFYSKIMFNANIWEINLGSYKGRRKGKGRREKGGSKLASCTVHSSRSSCSQQPPVHWPQAAHLPRGSHWRESRRWIRDKPLDKVAFLKETSYTSIFQKGASKFHLFVVRLFLKFLGSCIMVRGFHPEGQWYLQSQLNSFHLKWTLFWWLEFITFDIHIKTTDDFLLLSTQLLLFKI